MELVLTDDTSCITPRSACFFSITRCVTCHLKRELIRRNYFILKKICQGYFCCWDEIKVLIIYFIKVIFKFWQLPCSFKCRTVYNVWYTHFNVTFFCIVVEHKVNEGTFEFCTHIIGNTKAASCKFYAAFEVYPAILFCKFPVLFWSKIKFTWSEYAPQFNITLFIFSVWNIIIRNVGNSHSQAFKLFLAESLNLQSIRDTNFIFIHFCFKLRDVFTLALVDTKLFTHGILCSLECFKVYFCFFELFKFDFYFFE